MKSENAMAVIIMIDNTSMVIKQLFSDYRSPSTAIEHFKAVIVNIREQAID